MWQAKGKGQVGKGRCGTGRCGKVVCCGGGGGRVARYKGVGKGGKVVAVAVCGRCAVWCGVEKDNGKADAQRRMAEEWECEAQYTGETGSR